jgi:hypothetical protein
VTGAGSARRRSRHDRRQGASLAVRVLLTAIALAGHHAGTASAQQGRPSIVVATPLRIQPPAQVALPVQLSPLSAVPPGCFIRMRGLPSTAALSDGHSIAPGAWAIPIAALTKLEIVLPEGATGQSEISITLVSADGTVLAETKATLVVTARPAPAAPPAAAAPTPRATTSLAMRPIPDAPPPPAETRAAPLLSPEAHERALRLVKKGDEQLADGGIAQARLLYERAAEAGLAQGAMAMAATYDPTELQRLGVRGLKPDRDQARRWYERARQLGAADAEQRLRRLGGS